MCNCGKSRGRIAAFAFTTAALTLMVWSPVAAEPVRITVGFRVMGDHNRAARRRLILSTAAGRARLLLDHRLRARRGR